jgi:hypothetical protein
MLGHLIECEWDLSQPADANELERWLLVCTQTNAGFLYCSITGVNLVKTCICACEHM